MDIIDEVKNYTLYGNIEDLKNYLEEKINSGNFPIDLIKSINEGVLINAATIGRVDVLEYIIDVNNSWNKDDDYGYILSLLCSFNYENSNFVDNLLKVIKKGANVSWKDDLALKLCCANQQIKAIDLLIEHGANREQDFLDYILDAIKNQNFNTAEFLLIKFKNNVFNNKEVIEYISIYGNERLIDLIIELGANVVRDNMFIYAVWGANLPVVKHISKNVKEIVKYSHDAINHVFSSGTYENGLEVLKFLVDYLDYPLQMKDSELLKKLIALNFIDGIKYLKSKGVEICSEKQDSLRKAIYLNRKEIVKYLIEDCSADIMVNNGELLDLIKKHVKDLDLLNYLEIIRNKKLFNDFLTNVDNEIKIEI